MIEVKNLVRRYGNFVAVDHLSFTLESGKIYGFLGPNGAGKSTTMNMMTGYIGATEGTVVINGHDILKEPDEAKRCIGYLPEMPPLYMDMTVDEYLNFVAELKEIPPKERKQQISEVSDRTGVTEVRKRLIRNLSKGYRQRVGLAQAILGKPEFIILDEPTVGLDPKQIIEIRELIRDLGRDHTVILSSHILSEVSAICDHIMIISHGRLVASDTAENLMRMMDSSHTVDIVLKGQHDEIREALGTIENITKVEERAAAEGFFSAKLYTDGTEIRERLFRICASNEWPIYEVQYSKASLEDVFMKLTSDDEKFTQETMAANAEGEVSDAEPEESPETDGGAAPGEDSAARDAGTGESVSESGSDNESGTADENGTEAHE